jgi:hypothetical protein
MASCAPGTAAMPVDRGCLRRRWAGRISRHSRGFLHAVVLWRALMRRACKCPVRAPSVANPPPASCRAGSCRGEDHTGASAVIQVSRPWLAILPSLTDGYCILQQFRLSLRFISTPKHLVVEEVIIPQSVSGLMRVQIRKQHVFFQAA